MPSPVPSPHDQFFRAVFSQQPLAADFLRHYLPAAVVEHLDLATLSLRPGSFVDDDLRAHHSDLLYEVRLEGGGSSLVYVLFEHKSRPDRFVALQLLRYIVRIWEHDARDRSAHRRDVRERETRDGAARDRDVRDPREPSGPNDPSEPRGASNPSDPIDPGNPAPRRRAATAPGPRLVLPLVLYHGRRRWNVARSLSALYDGPPDLKHYCPELNYALVDLGAIPEADIAGQAALRVALLVLRSIVDPDLGRRLPELLQPLRDHPTPLGMLQVVMQYIVQANVQVTRDDVAAALEAVDADEGDAEMPTLAQQWVEEGRAEGRVEGLAKGRIEGLHAAIADALDERFGAEGRGLADDARAVTDPTALRALLRTIWRAETLEDARRAVTSS